MASALWALRILAPPHGSVLERCVMEHYGREAGYVFAWANLFTRALWPLGLVMLIYGLAGVGPGAEGTEAIPWYSMQLLLLVWGLIVTGLSSSRSSV
ncbi:unnamed protein product [Effrenium voratum]|nr:unnamed protein product [Effrenium voratum]